MLDKFSIGAVGNNFILIAEISRPYQLPLIEDYLESNVLDLMKCPARSSDLNPKERV